MKVFGISNCSTVRKARAWLDDRCHGYDFIDFRKSPPQRRQLARWVEKFGWETVLNRRGNTWRMLGLEVQSGVRDPESAIDVMLANPSSIKRPIIEVDDDLLIGFDEAAYASRLHGALPEPRRKA
ncbi:MAG: Spx/MgsR family RNA polymerase-binding regulatory protein [Pseudomonadota bacterium]|nr:Spx/MgsR family RNA polymerase-binding regulatory protein [Pseudomonadota bacterium]